jgi:ectoine hydroxylase-related dioxygenase (phytanoyl-CoA dioxygenase family)
LKQLLLKYLSEKKMTRILTPKQLDRYADEGFVVIEDVVPATTILRMKDVLAELVEKSRQVQTHDDVYDLEPGHRPTEPRVRRIKKPHEIDPVFSDLMTAPKFMAILQDLLGEDVRLHGSKLNLKAPHFGSPVEWHQDWAFYPHSNDDVLAAAVMLDDTTVENGAMYVIPGSHKGPTHNHHDAEGYFCGSIDLDTSAVDFARAVACEGPAGSVSFHHVRAVHGSAQNVSTRSRGLLLYEFSAADAYPLMAAGKADWKAFSNRMICGKDTITPRCVATPIRMPLPPAKNQGSIYENQTSGKRYFGFVEQGGKKSVLNPDV